MKAKRHTLYRVWRRSGAPAALIVFLLFVFPASVAAQPWDPSAAISAYSAAFNAHDTSAALALFDQYGSATDGTGHHFVGTAGLADFLEAGGISTPDAFITTQALRVVGNRAVWTYRCTCATQATEVRLVMNHDKISVFFVVGPPTGLQPSRPTQLAPWVIGSLLGAAATFVALVTIRRGRPTPPVLSSGHGRLLAALRESRASSRLRG